MDIKDIRLKKGMSKEEVNELISEWILLEDDIYMGNAYKHNWKCKCGDVIKERIFKNIIKGAIDCGCSLYRTQEKYYKDEVEKCGEYEYIRSYRKGEVTPKGRIPNRMPYLQVKHKYCGEIYEIQSGNFINNKQQCGQCCVSYENSFAHFIEVELGLDINDVWDFEKNTVNPYHIWKNSQDKIWIKCQEKDYHDSYEVRRSDFVKGNRCPYCINHKVHPKDSFAQYHIDNTDKDFLEKYWDYENNILDPWEISPSSHNKIWVKCQNEEVNELNRLKKKDYHPSYNTSCYGFTSGSRCKYCHSGGATSNYIHPYDSFGYHNFDKINNFIVDENVSLFRVNTTSHKKYLVLCDECGNTWNISLCNLANGRWCPQCNRSKGEKKVKSWLDYNNINYIHDEPYFDDLLGVGMGVLRPDFILPERKIWIEYDGEFHYRDMTGVLKINKEHDKRKDSYAKKHGWKLIRIPYWDFDNIETILQEKIINKNKLI